MSRLLGLLFILMAAVGFIFWWRGESPSQSQSGLSFDGKPQSRFSFCDFWVQKVENTPAMGPFEGVQVKIYGEFPEKPHFLRALQSCFLLDRGSSQALVLEFFSDQWPIHQDSRLQIQWSVFQGGNKIFEDGDVILGDQWLKWVQESTLLSEP